MKASLSVLICFHYVYTVLTRKLTPFITYTVFKVWQFVQYSKILPAVQKRDINVYRQRRKRYFETNV